MLTNVMPMLRCQKVRHPYNEVKIILKHITWGFKT